MKCDPYCLQCENSICLKCVNGFYPNDKNCIACPKPNQYFDSSNTCADCPSGCGVCENSKECLQCHPGYSLDKYTKKCIECPLNCASCKSINTCEVCDYGYSNDQDNSECIRTKNTSPKILTEVNKPKPLEINFPSEHFDQNVSFKSIPWCKVVKDEKCLLCDVGYFLNDNTCFACIDDCLRCTNNLDCLLCDTGYSLVKNKGSFTCFKKNVTLRTYIEDISNT